jgi:hypothetical protein
MTTPTRRTIVLLVLLIAALSGCAPPEDPKTRAARDAYAAWMGAQDDVLTGRAVEEAVATLPQRSGDDMYAMLQWKLSGFAADGVVQRGRHEISRFHLVDPHEVDVPAEYGMAVSPDTAALAARACLDASAVAYLDARGAEVGDPTGRQSLDLLFTADGPGDALVVAYAGKADAEVCG